MNGKYDMVVANNIEAGDGWHAIERGKDIYAAGQGGGAWRVMLGVVRLDRAGEDGPEFGGLALAGDVIGAETLLLGSYTFSARALTPVVIEPWGAAAERASSEVLLQALTTTEGRVADTLALRNGSPDRRINRLLALMGRGLAHGRKLVRVALPQLRDIAEMTGLTVETVSRTISRLKEAGELDVRGNSRERQVWVTVK